MHLLIELVGKGQSYTALTFLQSQDVLLAPVMQILKIRNLALVQWLKACVVWNCWFFVRLFISIYQSYKSKGIISIYYVLSLPPKEREMK